MIDPEPREMSRIGRRSALTIVLGGAGAICAGLTSLAAGFVSNALRLRPERSWVRVGPAEDLDAETFKKHVIRFEHTHAWHREKSPLLVFVKDAYPDDPVAFSSTCSHLGCSVSWVAEDRQFHCPCHGGVYDESGAVVDGPPPRPLTRLEVKIEDEIFYIMPPAMGGGTA